MFRRRLLFMVGVLTMVVLAAFAMPAIANEDMASTPTDVPENTTILPDGDVPQTFDNDTITASGDGPVDGIEQANNAPQSCWEYSEVFERWKWDCD